MNIGKALAAWLLMLIVAVANGALRDYSYGRSMDELSAHQLSTLIGSVLIGALVWAYVRRYRPSTWRQALALGLFWVALTVAFEFLFFHYAGGRSWSALLANYDLLHGRVWVLFLLWIALAPSVFRRFS